MKMEIYEHILAIFHLIGRKSSVIIRYFPSAQTEMYIYIWLFSANSIFINSFTRWWDI